ncbi:putative ABC transporter ATP-binding protein YxlF [compost metagenome]
MAKGEAHITDLSKTIKQQRIVDQISFSVTAGNILALCGGNGAGKSTVLRMIVGILRPTSGDIVVNGLRLATARKSFSEQIGYMPDDYQFQQGLTAAETLQFWASLRKVPAERVEEVLVMVGLEEQRNKRVNTFSKGMRQRILFAQALLANPPLLVMDEPTNGLDPFWMQELIRLLKGLKKEGHMVIFSTHQLDIAEQIAEQVVFMNAGRNVGSGATEHICRQYGSLHAAFHQSLGLNL